jgi:hypothetical protein
VFEGVSGLVTTDILCTGGALGYALLLPQPLATPGAQVLIFRKLLISAHQFANQFQAERAAGYPHLSLIQAMTSHLDQLTDAEHRLRVQLKQP